MGYQTDDLIKHLERQFVPRMGWHNYGSEWEIDHIIPLCKFRLCGEADDEFRAAWALTNLRPLWSMENNSKGGRRILLL